MLLFRAVCLNYKWHRIRFRCNEMLPYLHFFVDAFYSTSNHVVIIRCTLQISVCLSLYLHIHFTSKDSSSGRNVLN